MQKRTAEKMAVLIGSRPGWIATVHPGRPLKSKFSVEATYTNGSTLYLNQLGCLSNRRLLEALILAYEEGRLGAKRC